ncbi:hypothetical protein SYNTR_1733 [Candidatus Syntrophocurvum alkaliphilum]|uniref:Uncharacterized protein n=1 Tax=Candidatus Syntrophocurvum alkaliphilum TaxID=2293317 RepID=A0A6I6DHS6_9FIRM|nr:hypothetical protein [Candidatus Syntrophocurvum alkaliphilum]QGU00327.1 hypothetical protein SYNTR_1733 [Candidatus Syntrophocurvum alkaliphilum]
MNLDKTELNHVQTADVSNENAEKKINLSEMVADTSKGEMTLHSLPGLGGLLTGNLSPLQFLLGSITRFFQGFKLVFSNFKALLLIILISLVWLVLTILNSFVVDSQFIKILNFLTFAQGGTSGGVAGLIGGIVGKGLLTYLVFTTVLNIFGNKKIASSISGIKVLLGALQVRKNKSLDSLLLGSGISLIAYNFMAGDITPMSNMAAITGLILSLRALSNRAGFLRGFIRSIIYQIFKDIPAVSRVNYIIAGLSSGFALAIPLSYISGGSIGYIAGITLLIVALVIKFVYGKREEVASS